MTMNMLEQMARAIRDNPPTRTEQVNECGEVIGFSLDYVPQAKAALECLKEPTGGMKQVVAADWGRKSWERYEWIINAALEGK